MSQLWVHVCGQASTNDPRVDASETALHLASGQLLYCGRVRVRVRVKARVIVRVKARADSVLLPFWSWLGLGQKRSRFFESLSGHL